MSDPHCSKCCPVEPPGLPERVEWAPAVFVWATVLAALVAGGWLLIVWAGSSIWP